MEEPGAEIAVAEDLVGHEKEGQEDESPQQEEKLKLEKKEGDWSDRVGWCLLLTARRPLKY